MKQHERQASAFEVFCNRCHTSFAVGTKRCVHCGERLSRQRIQGLDIRDAAPSPIEAAPVLDPTLILDDEEPKRSGAFSPFTLVWIVILLGGYLVRACTQGG